MNSIARHSTSLLKRPSQIVESLSFGNQHQLQQWRGIRVKVLNGNLESALTFMQRKMQSSGMERLIKREQTHHIKNSEKRILARKNLERKIRSQELARKLQAILLKKVRFHLGGGEDGIHDMLMFKRVQMNFLSAKFTDWERGVYERRAPDGGFLVENIGQVLSFIFWEYHVVDMWG
ncbi:hypothetical protein FEM48_Zijuj10G0054900 [Ziziphus jujuba var. spinosa]|uniref:Uncharacterized protein n=1 Tax=Ziziphus jujuba var. spinosa TaxID=714518 RepID=A0A978ULK4_ZIZJJ|nr:hypothetical protein FEM48_Zijuj10G0054900 [Ziziphus jujuba var. spinosa]